MVRHSTKRLCQCIGLSSLVLVPNYGDLLGGGADVRMHVPYRLTAICAAQIADIVLLGVALFVVLQVFRRTRFYSWVTLLFVLLAPPYVLERLSPVLRINVQEWWAAGFAAVWTGAILLLLLRYPSWYQRVVRAGDAVGTFLAVFGLFSVAQLVWVMRWRPGAQRIRAAWETASQDEELPARVHPKLVWVLFDELSYEQVFGHRAHDLKLKNFDALRSESTLYTEVQPIGMRTVKIVPSLFSGGVVDDVRYGFDNSFGVRYQGTHAWRGLTGAGTVFADAKSAGWRTSVVGWYNPYCTSYGDALDECYWSNLDRTDGDLRPGVGFWRNVWTPLKEAATEMVAPREAARMSCDVDVRQRVKTYVDLDERAQRVIAEDQADFVFLHFATPHSPNIWSRVNDGYVNGCGSSYLDNLALADRELGRVMEMLRSSPRWKNTTVIVQGDHSWRVMLWEDGPSWTEEDEQASKGEFDPRPELLIHRAGQTEAQTDARAMPLMYVHGLIEDVVRGR